MAAGKSSSTSWPGGSRKPSTVDTIMAREHFVRQNGRPVFKAAVKGMSEVVTEVMQRNDLTAETVDWLVPHQANIRIIDTVSKMVNFPAGESDGQYS